MGGLLVELTSLSVAVSPVETPPGLTVRLARIELEPFKRSVPKL